MEDDGGVIQAFHPLYLLIIGRCFRSHFKYTHVHTQFCILWGEVGLEVKKKRVYFSTSLSIPIDCLRNTLTHTYTSSSSGSLDRTSIDGHGRKTKTGVMPMHDNAIAATAAPVASCRHRFGAIVIPKRTKQWLASILFH